MGKIYYCRTFNTLVGVGINLLEKIEEKQTLPITVTTRECELDTLHPDLTKYVPRVPPSSERCYVDIGIAGKDVGEPKWGHVSALTYEYYPEVEVGYLGLMYVFEEFRRRGYARRMVKYALEDMRKRGIKKVYTAPVRPASVELFRSLRFSKFGDTPLYCAEV